MAKRPTYGLHAALPPRWCAGCAKANHRAENPLNVVRRGGRAAAATAAASEADAAAAFEAEAFGFSDGGLLGGPSAAKPRPLSKLREGQRAGLKARSLRVAMADRRQVCFAPSGGAPMPSDAVPSRPCMLRPLGCTRNSNSTHQPRCFV